MPTPIASFYLCIVCGSVSAGTDKHGPWWKVEPIAAIAEMEVRP